METRRRTWFDDRGVVVAPGVDGAEPRHLPFYAGAMHYWRIDPARWASCLAALHDVGLTLVETYVPWRVHEPAAGCHAWDGPRDLARFLDAARAAGLAVVLRPGPHVNAELTSFGMPDHVLADPACQARTASGSPVWMPSPPRAWPVPSYASRAFRGRVHAWFAEVAEIVGPRIHPDGPVVAIGVDNEAQMFFRLGAYDHDYHPDAILDWREASGLDGDPPRAWDPADAARCISWLRFKDQYVAHALGAFARSLDEVGLGGVARFHNLPAGHHGLYDLRGIQRAIGGPVGIDAYTPRTELRALRQRGIAAVGNAAPVPIAFEVGVGFAPWLPPLDAGDDPTRERDQLLSLLATGIRGFNLFMAVERDRYYGAAIDRSGKLAPHAAWIRTLIAALVELEWPTLRRAAPIAIVDGRADARFGQASCVLDPMTPVVGELLRLGPAGAAELGGDAAAVLARRWQAAIARALDLARVPYTVVDESATEAELAELRAVIAPTFDRIDRGLAHTLRALAEHPATAHAGTPAGERPRERAARKRVVVVIGPGTPAHDELGQPLLPDSLPRRVGRLKAGSLEDLPGLAADLAALAGEPSDAWQIERPDDVHAYAHADPEGEVRVVFVASDVDRPVSAVLLVGETTRALRDPFGHERVLVAGGRATIALAPRGVRMLVVERA
ncbi:MAG TPA: beta-galactosidase [Kofleriaceae bacterium]|nr:beta-galactosidase [Kofleriaceae bacterium]